MPLSTISQKSKLKKTFFDSSLEQWNFEISVGLTGAFLVSKFFLKIWLKEGKVYFKYFLGFISDCSRSKTL